MRWNLPDSLTEIVVVLTLILLVAVPAQAQDGSFGEVIDVRVVNLEVVVTQKGERITGLGPEDFVLTVDGREVPIEYFTEVHGGTAVLHGEEAAGSAVPALAPGVEVGTSYLVFIDEFFAIPTDRNRILRRMIDQLAFLSPKDRMAVVAFDGTKVDMLSTWSQSPRELERVLQKAIDRPAFGLARRAEQRLFESTRDLRAGAIVNEPLGETTVVTGDLEIDERVRADELVGQVKRAVLAASSALRSFANPPGRKVMLLLSGGWPYNPAQWVIRQPDRFFYTSNFDDGDKIYRQLAETANRLSYTLYPIDVPGLDVNSVNSAEFSNNDAAFNRLVVEEREREEETTLHALARETGGRAMIDGASTTAFQRVFEDTRSYYWLGFTPDWQGDDESHKIRIKTRRKGFDVRSRKGFADLSRETEVTMMVESALLFGDPPGLAPLGAYVGKGERAGRGKVMIPLKVVIPIAGLTFLPIQEGFQAETELRIAVLDEDGNTSDIPVIPLAFRTADEPEGDKVTVYETAMKIRKKKHDLVVSVYDKPSGRILSTKVEVDPTSR
ncbi:MAG: VWA domain-containing protein [Acidobacteriota bacterium]